MLRELVRRALQIGAATAVIVAAPSLSLAQAEGSAEAGAAALRRHREGDLGTLSVEAFIEKLKAEDAAKAR